MNKMNRKMLALAVLLLLLVSIPAAYAYFSTFTGTDGNKPVYLKDETKLIENNGDVKTVTVEAEPGSYPVYVRVMAFCTDKTAVNMVDTQNWTAEAVSVEEGYNIYTYYYNEAIDDRDDTAFAKATTTLTLKVELPDVETYNYQPGDELHVAVVYETVPAVYDDATEKYLPADWTNTKIGGNS